MIEVDKADVGSSSDVTMPSARERGRVSGEHTVDDAESRTNAHWALGRTTQAIEHAELNVWQERERGKDRRRG